MRASCCLHIKTFINCSLGSDAVCLTDRRLVNSKAAFRQLVLEGTNELSRGTAPQHIALTVNEELGLQARLLDELDEDVDVSHSRLRAAQKRLKHVLATSGNCRSLCITIGLMCILAVMILIGFKLF